MPCLPYSTASARVEEFTPPFAALYAERPGTPNTAPPEETLTIDPPPASIMCGIAYFDVQNMLVERAAHDVVPFLGGQLGDRLEAHVDQRGRAPRC